MAASGIPANLGQAQRERLAHIDFRLWFLGEVSRADICARFGVAPAGATRDLALYREAASDNIVFDGSSKTYRIGDSFSPLFEHPLDRVLSSLSLFGVPCLVQGLLACLPRVRVGEQGFPGDVPADAVVVVVRRLALWELSEEGAEGESAVGVGILLYEDAQLEARRAVGCRER